MPAQAPEPAPDPPQEPIAPRLPQRLRRRLAALSVVGALLVAWPLVQLLRYQGHEVQALLEERAALDPVARAVDVQRSLLAHRELASLVLRGRRAAEAPRKQRQVEVDERVAALGRTLKSGAWERAEREADALHEDWTTLVRQVLGRSIAAPESDQAHRLLMEQTLQVIDLVADTAASHAGYAGDSGAATEATLAVAHMMPRLAWQLAALSTPASDDEDADLLTSNLAATEAALARSLGRLDAALEREGGTQSPLAAAGAAAGAAAERTFQLLRGGPPRAAEVPAAASAAVQAQFHLFEQAHAAAAAALGERSDRAQQARAVSLALTAALVLAAAMLLWQLAQGLRALQGGPPPPPPSNGEHSDRAEAGRLLQRLRVGDERHTRGNPPAVHEEPQATLPPAL